VILADERYELTRPVARRAATSIPANIAEGCGRDGDAEFGRFLGIAAGSASELEYFALLARDLGILNDSGYDFLNQRIVEVKRMLASLKEKLKADSL